MKLPFKKTAHQGLTHDAVYRQLIGIGNRAQDALVYVKLTLTQMFALNVLTSAVLWILGDPEGLHIDLFALSVNIPTQLLTLTNVLYLFCEMVSHFM